ncbi:MULTISPECIES: glycoside hydrolase family 3 N-terminal domain-containing protein [unclassified Corynebacterium]|uniref:glycoside hydrolase family 3 N-terminal domain-containing protein n=1 Tax=unclassified Corynebacterium TaxID=2624378 RepID=UPI0029C9D135|nr:MULTISPECIES: glycoside hydrolase family 3 N-terminal domain-containing protein [unclassified Corynebacterium]WPF65989.1 glycoside hydrolase family 3 N-terminal domain-containing protein [Corynebacterium sp. 22KM0430]WPF68482.1 glycoside hydrolase family 3 N-terminal domain-containing protein [Corynebacterium sp. 21KM1197]
MRLFRNGSVAVALSAAMLVGCVSAEETPTPPSVPSTPSSVPAATTTTTTPDPVTEASISMTPEERRTLAASLMVVGVKDYDDALAKLQQGVGGIFITSWADPGILTEPGRDIAALREAVGRDFSVSIDFEGGRVQRHSSVLGDFPSPREMADTLSPQETEALAHRLGQSLREHGITIDFAPVLDVDSAHLEVIGDRSFATEPQRAAEYAAAFARGLHAAGVKPVFKHFPGHGAASGDTHKGAAVTPPIEELGNLDLSAYGPALSSSEGAGVMVGHLVVPGLSAGDTPASIDPNVYELLRSGAYPHGTPFGGTIYTDDLSGMKAITDRMSTADAVVAAIVAGADRALWSSGEAVEEAIDKVAAAVEDGRLSEDRLRASAAVPQS